MFATARRRAARSAAAVVLTLGAGVMPALTTSGSSATAAESSDACGVVLPKDGGGTWQCTFVDEFNGWSLDSTKWSAVDTRYSGFRIGNACFDEDRNLSVRGGELRMSTTETWRSFTCDSPLGDFATRYRGSGITTGQKFAQAFGRFEARIKFPNTEDTGLHSNFWMNPLKRVYGAWPLSGEIDIAEWYSGAAGHVLPALHYAGSTAQDVGWWACDIAGGGGEFHTYAVEWTRDLMTFSVDGHDCWSRRWDGGDLIAPAPFDQPFTLSIVNGVGPDASNAVTRATDFPAVTVVDYVKAWS